MLKVKLYQAFFWIIFSVVVVPAATASTDDFVFAVNTTFSSGTADFTIPIYGTGFKYDVDCDDDGNFETVVQTSAYTCDYSASGGGVYTIRIKSDDTFFPRFRFDQFNEAVELVNFVQWGTSKWDSMSGAFKGTVNLIFSATDVPDLSNVASTHEMFSGAGLAEPDTSNWDTSNVAIMSNMFFRAYLANPNTSGWDTSKVTNMSGMFYQARVASPDTSGWDTSKVTNMRQMFFDAEQANPDTSGWNTSKVTNMYGMFNDAEMANPGTSGWNTANVTDMSRMFFKAEVAAPDTSGWDTSNVADMSFMFFFARVANPVTVSWDTSVVVDMQSMFSGAYLADPDVSMWNTSNVTNMSAMFSGADVAEPDTSGWDTALVTDMSFMFANAGMVNPDTSGWDISSVTTMEDMFLNVTLSTASYDGILADFSFQVVQPGVLFNVGNSMYCNTAAHENLSVTDNWVITDGGLDPLCGDLIFKNSFDVPVVTFAALNKTFTYDFAQIAQVKLDSYPQLIAVGLDGDDRPVIKFHIRKTGQQLQMRISDLDQDAFETDSWVEHQWQDVNSDGLIEVNS